MESTQVTNETASALDVTNDNPGSRVNLDIVDYIKENIIDSDSENSNWKSD